MKVPARLLKENQTEFVIRDDISTILIELSAVRSDLFKDVYPGSGGMPFQEFLK